MFVVRTLVEGSTPNFKAFERKPDAEEFFRKAAPLVLGHEARSVALFEVPATNDVRAAIEAVRSGKNDRANLLKIEPGDFLSTLNLADLGL